MRNRVITTLLTTLLGGLLVVPSLQAQSCSPEGAKVSNGDCQEVLCCADPPGLVCEEYSDIAGYAGANPGMGSAITNRGVWCVRPAANQQVEEPTQPEEPKPVVFKPQVGIPGSITIGGRTITFRKGEAVVVTGETIAEYLAVFYRFFIMMLVVAAVVMVTYGGFKRVMAAGGSERIKDANDVVFKAIVGLVLALVSYSLLNLINPRLTSFKTLEVYEVKRENWTGEQSDTGVADTPSTGDYFKQCDPQWGTMPYVEAGNASCNLCSSGCGATAVAIVLKSKGVSVTPREVGQYAIQIGARKGCSNGTSVAQLTNKPYAGWGVETKVVSSFDVAMSSLERGEWLVASIKQVPVPGKCQNSGCGVGVCFCGGHYVVFAGKHGDTVNVIDPSRVGITSMTVSEVKKYLNNGFYHIWK